MKPPFTHRLAYLVVAMSLSACCGCGGGGGGGGGTPDKPGPTPGVTINGHAMTFAENGRGRFNVTLNTVPNGTVALTATTSDTTEALVSLDSGATGGSSVNLSFDASNWDLPQTVTLLGQTDNIPDGNTYITITVKPDVANTADTSGYADLAARQVVSQILDSDVVMVSAINLDTSIQEGGAFGSFDLVLNSAPNGDVTVLVTISDITEISFVSEEGDWRLYITSVTFNESNWSTPQNVRIYPLDDNVADGPQRVQATLSIDTDNTTDTSGYSNLQVGELSPVAITVADNDVTGIADYDPSYTTDERQYFDGYIDWLW